MNPAIKGWKNGWQAFGSSLLPLAPRSPEVIALMRYLVGRVSTNHSGPPARSGAETETVVSSTTGCGKEGPAVLFLPLFSRGYCLGSCLKIAREIHRSNADIPIMMIRPDGEIGSAPRYVEFLDMRSLRKKGLIKLPMALGRAMGSYHSIVKVLSEDVILKEELTRTFGRWKLHILRWLGLYYYDEALAAALIGKRRIRSVVTINDVVKPSAPFVTAANRAGIQTVVLQHGTPGPHSAPFLAREGWVWGETSKKALVGFGGDPAKLKIMGGLESEGIVRADRQRQSSPKVLVFLAQWRATRGWGQPFFQEVFSLLGEVLKAKEDHWVLRVRLHPTDPEEARSDVEHRLRAAGVSPLYSKSDATMEEELESADALLSVSSSGLINGVASGLPTAQWLPAEVESHVGPAILASDDVLRDAGSLTKWLDDLAEGRAHSGGEVVLANRGEVANKMASEILKVLSC